MKIRVVHYRPSASPTVQAFFDVELGGWLRINGLNLHRDGSLRPAQLSWMRDGQREYRDAVLILDTDLAQQLTADILATIHAHVALLPPEHRMRPPAPPKTSRKQKVSVAPPVPPAREARNEPNPDAASVRLRSVTTHKEKNYA